MDLFISTQSCGGIRVVSISKSEEDHLQIKTQSELIGKKCPQGDSDSTEKILSFQFQRKQCFVVAKKSGLIQLYQRCGSSHQLYKEWKNSNLNSADLIVSLGVLNSQYLYTCSRGGKLVIRDLVHDDANESYKVYLVNKPVSDLQLSMAGRRIQILCAGKNNELKLYEIEALNTQPQPSLFKIHDSSIRSTLALRPLGRTFTSLNLSRSNSGAGIDRHVTVLCPSWSAVTETGKLVYEVQSMDSVSQWVSSICQVGNLVACGTQYGKLLTYNLKGDFSPMTSLEVSHFAISYLTRFLDKYVIFCDSMSQVGILNVPTGEIIKTYGDLEIGSSASMKFILPQGRKCDKHDTQGGRRRKVNAGHLHFSPIYLLCTTLDKRMVVYKLLEDNNSELLLNIKLTSQCNPILDIANQNEYRAMQDLFGYDYEGFEDEVSYEYEHESTTLHEAETDIKNYTEVPRSSFESIKRRRTFPFDLQVASEMIKPKTVK